MTRAKGRGPFVTVAVLGLVISACSGSPEKPAGGPAPTSPAGGPAPTSAAAAPEDKNNSADHLLFWIGHREFASLTDAELRQWKDRGVDGFIAVVFALNGMGGKNDFTGDPATSLQGENYTIQRELRDSRIMERTRALGMKNYLGFYLANTDSGATPLKDWFDDNAWSTQVLPKVRDLAAAAKLLGFAGLAFDQELYPQTGNVQRASWAIGYAGNTRSEAETRAKVKQRGGQLMTTILDVFPGVEIVGYSTQLPQSWEEFVQERGNNIPNAMGSIVSIDLWNGLTSVVGYKAIHLLDAIFYKSPQVSGATWDTALQYNANRLYSLFSRSWDNWAYASSRVDVVPFSWIDGGPTRFEAARSPDYVAEQLLAFRKWAAGREFANFANMFKTFDYTPYAKGMQAASTPAVVDSEPPVLQVEGTRRTDSTVTITGAATDNLAIRAVRWQVLDGPSGAAKMTWTVKGGSHTSQWDWEMTWTADIPLTRGLNSIVVSAEDIKGLSTTRTVPVTL